MNYCHGHTAGPRWCYPDDYSGETGGGGGGGDTSCFAVDKIADYSTTDDLFELVWEQGGGGAGGAPRLRTMQPAAGSWSPPRFKPPPPPRPEARFEPPSEAQMAAWLCTIVRGEELAVNGDGGGREVPMAAKESTTTDSEEKLIPATEGTGTMQEMEKPTSAGGSSSRSHHAAHNLTEKRRRHKINERLKTLQQIVPGCDNKSNQASTLDHTIQYMKSLQQHVQAMSINPARPAAAATVPVLPPQYAAPGAPPVAVPMMPAASVVLASAPTTMVPFGAMLQMPHYPAAVPVMMPGSASAAPLYPAAAPPRAAAVAPGGAGSSTSHRQNSGSRKGKGGRSLRKKH